MNPKTVAYDFIENFGNRTKDQNEEVLSLVRRMSYRSTRDFIYILMNCDSDEIKKFMFDSEVIADYIYENQYQLHQDIINDAKPNYKIISGDGEKVFIVDLGSGNISVTCGAANVCRDIEKSLTGSRQIIYRDLLGNWDEIKSTKFPNGALKIKFVPYEGKVPEYSCGSFKESDSLLKWPEGTEYLSKGPFFRPRKYQGG